MRRFIAWLTRVQRENMTMAAEETNVSGPTCAHLSDLMAMEKEARFIRSIDLQQFNSFARVEGIIQ